MPKKGSSNNYKRVGQGQDEDRRVPKGFVPILVGLEGTSAERILVRVKQFNDPRLVGLLDMAEHELGCQPQGVLRVTCDVDYFRRLVGAPATKFR